jgi:hypothetical protein
VIIQILQMIAPDSCASLGLCPRGPSSRQWGCRYHGEFRILIATGSTRRPPNRVKLTKSTPWHHGGVAFAAYAGRSTDARGE